jgi:hypothetical protein
MPISVNHTHKITVILLLNVLRACDCYQEDSFNGDGVDIRTVLITLLYLDFKNSSCKGGAGWTRRNLKRRNISEMFAQKALPLLVSPVQIWQVTVSQTLVREPATGIYNAVVLLRAYTVQHPSPHSNKWSLQRSPWIKNLKGLSHEIKRVFW